MHERQDGPSLWHPPSARPYCLFCSFKLWFVFLCALLLTSQFATVCLLQLLVPEWEYGCRRIKDRLPNKVPSRASLVKLAFQSVMVQFVLRSCNVADRMAAEGQAER